MRTGHVKRQGATWKRRERRTYSSGIPLPGASAVAHTPERRATLHAHALLVTLSRYHGTEPRHGLPTRWSSPFTPERYSCPLSQAAERGTHVPPGSLEAARAPHAGAESRLAASLTPYSPTAEACGLRGWALCQHTCRLTKSEEQGQEAPGVRRSAAANLERKPRVRTDLTTAGDAR